MLQATLESAHYIMSHIAVLPYMSSYVTTVCGTGYFIVLYVVLCLLFDVPHCARVCPLSSQFVSCVSLTLLFCTLVFNVFPAVHSV